MKRTTPPAAAPLVLLLSCLVACDDAAAPGSPGVIQFPTELVTILGDTAPFIITPDPVRVPPGARIEWLHLTADTFRIDLSALAAGGVLPADSSQLAQIGGIRAGATILPFAPADTFKYAVTVTIGGRTTTDDPRIIVRPD